MQVLSVASDCSSSFVDSLGLGRVGCFTSFDRIALILTQVFFGMSSVV